MATGHQRVQLPVIEPNLLAMHQPEPLRTDQLVPWSWGVGNDVWSLFESAMQGDDARTRKLLDRTPSLVHASYAYRNALHFAVRENQPGTTQLLLERGSKITYTGERWHASAIVQAADRGYREVAETLTQHQLEQFGICEAGDALADAIRDRALGRVRQLLQEHGPNVADVRGNTPLHWGALTRQTAVIDLCLDAGGDINASRPDGARAIDLTHGDYWYRTWNNEVGDKMRNAWPIVGYLLAKGAEYDLGTACRIGDLERVKEILKTDPEAANKDADYVAWYSGFPLRNACKGGHLAIVKLLLDAGADPNKPEHGLAPWGASLFDATQSRHESVVSLLLQRGADPNQSVESSGTPLSICDHEGIRKQLLTAGATYDWFGCVYYNRPAEFAEHCEREPQLANNPELFMMATEKRNEELEAIFLRFEPELWSRMPAQLGDSPKDNDWKIERGMQVNQCNWLDQHQLHRDFDLAKLAEYQRLGVDLELIDSEHQSTPLGLAARRGNTDQVAALLEAGADPNGGSADFAKPLHWAHRYGHDKVAELLLRNGGQA